jgi:hypothetical protein
MAQQYFLVNDTRYDNHHGGLMVVGNLHQAMLKRGWRCSGSLPVSSPAGQLAKRNLQQTRLVIVNGEGSLHHDNRNANRLLEICRELQKTHPVVLLNTIWQENDPGRWLPVLQDFAGIYTRDRRSQKELAGLGIRAGYAPDLTFYDYPEFSNETRGKFGCTDSVLYSWTERALELCSKSDGIDFVTLFTGELKYTRGPKDWGRQLKYQLYPWVWEKMHLRVPPRYRSLQFAISDTGEFLQRLSSYRALCVARYHALCFAIQQKIPFLAVPSNSHKSEALLEEAGLPLDIFLFKDDDIAALEQKLREAADIFPEFEETIDAFRKTAKQKINTMFDTITLELE